MPMIRFPIESNGHDEFQFVHLVDRGGYSSPEQAQADFFAFIVAQPDAFNFCYEYLKVIAESRMAHGHSPLRVPTLIEFIELLEFRERELLRTTNATGDDNYWQWPSAWPAQPSWNSGVGIMTPDVQSAFVDYDRYQKYILSTTRRGIRLNKILAGHGAHALVDHVSSSLMRRLLDVLLSGGEEYAPYLLPVQPQVVRSMDLVATARTERTQEDHPRWKVDGVLGDYNEGKIRIHERAISCCSEDTGIERQFLIRVVLLHEFAHHCVHGIARYPASKTLSDILREALVQLFTYLALRDRSTPNPELDAFNALLPHQPPEYSLHKELLSICNEVQPFVSALRDVQHYTGELSYDQLRELVEELVERTPKRDK